MSFKRNDYQALEESIRTLRLSNEDKGRTIQSLKDRVSELEQRLFHPHCRIFDGGHPRPDYGSPRFLSKQNLEDFMANHGYVWEDRHVVSAGFKKVDTNGV